MHVRMGLGCEKRANNTATRSIRGKEKCRSVVCPVAAICVNLAVYTFAIGKRIHLVYVGSPCIVSRDTANNNSLYKHDHNTFCSFVAFYNEYEKR